MNRYFEMFDTQLSWYQALWCLQAVKGRSPAHLRETRLHVELLKHRVHVTSGSAVLQTHKP